MLVGKDIYLLQVEKKSLIQFVLMYVISTTLLLMVISIIYYQYQKGLYLETKRSSMQIYAEKVVTSIYDVETKSEIDRYYAEDRRYDIAIYDEKKKPIFAIFEDPVDLKRNFYDKNGSLYYIDKIELAHLKAKYIIIKGASIDAELESVREYLYMILTASLSFIIVLAYFLTKMFLKPIRNYISKIDDFIKDTTHELNTPIAAITMTIETIDKNNLDPKLLRKIMRIDIAAKTISNLYQDLSFVALYGKSPNRNELVDIEELVRGRIEYFVPLAEVKNLSFDTYMEPTMLKIDKNKLRILVDNLVSNAIKYNSKNGQIKIVLKDGYLSIEDNGHGIEPDKLHDIFARYSRFNDSSGGFGLGLNIVKMICNEYNIEISVKSEVGKGTNFELRWAVPKELQADL